MHNAVVLGAGHWHLPLYRDAFSTHHRVVGVWDSDPDAAARAGAEAIAVEPDLAYVLGVHAQMPEICRQLIAAKVPFVLEKPGAAAVADLAAIRDEAAAAGVPATVALVQRYGPLPGAARARGRSAARPIHVRGRPTLPLPRRRLRLGARPRGLRRGLPLPARCAFHRPAPPRHRPKHRLVALATAVPR